MDLGFSQQLQQQQKLIITQEMKMSLNLLQMNINELQASIFSELEENPVLELDTDCEDYAYDVIDYEKLIKQQKDVDYDFKDMGIVHDEEETREPISYTAYKKNLRDYLREQTCDLLEDPEIIKVCYYIIENIDERGYLGCSVKDICEELNISEKVAAYALNIIQDFQPWGVGARDLKECLKIQLLKKNIKDPKIFRIVQEFLELLADNKIKEIAKLLKTDIIKTQEYCREIKALEPKPARGFSTSDGTGYIIPEAYIRKIGNELHIIMNDKSIPRLMINEAYRTIVKDKNDEKALGFVKEKLGNAVALIKGIESRKNTIYNILEKITELQKDYFIYGERYLKPMTINNIAELLQLHESTISRAIKDKYIQTDFGLKRIKDMFTTAIASNSSEEGLSSQTVKKEIRVLIENEVKNKPLSDQDISAALEAMNIKISRRTVAKYREEMEIASSGKRKVF